MPERKEWVEMSNNVKKLENQCEARDKEIESLKQIVKNIMKEVKRESRDKQ